MKAVLDHIGIAVEDLPAALAFYRDALGLEVEAPEEVASQRVRAHFIPVGESKLELLEGTAADSPIAKYIQKRGPGLHHITLRVDDVGRAVDHLKQRGVRLIDEVPRPGAEGGTVAFIHPSAAHGVLVELKQASDIGHRTADRRQQTADSRPQTADPRDLVQRFSLGDLELIVVSDGTFRLDGGAMFGVVPKTMWSKVAPSDDRNRVGLAMRPLIVRGARTMIIDAGIGDKDDARFRDIYGVDRHGNLDETLAAAGLSVEDIDIVLATHLHFDHAGGFTVKDASGRIRPKFPRAQYVVRRGEWEDATNPGPRMRASYLLDNYVPLAAAGVLQLVDEDRMIMPGVRVQRTGGHTPHHQMIWIESKGKIAAYPADMMPTSDHLRDVWTMGFDSEPLDTISAKQAFLRDAIAREVLVFFEHDLHVTAGYVREHDGQRTIEPVKSD